MLGAAYVTGGQASVEVVGLTAGANTITAQYSGDAANSGNSVSFPVTVIILPPGVPTSISVPASSTNGSYAISWGAAAGGWVTSYELYEANNASLASQTQVYGGRGNRRRLLRFFRGAAQDCGAS